MCSHGDIIPLTPGCPATTPLSNPCCGVTHRELCCSPEFGSSHSFTIPFPAPSPFPFCCGIFSLLKWRCCLGTPRRQSGPQIWAAQEQELPEQQDNSMATSGATKLTGAPGTRGLPAKSLHKSNDEHSALGIWGRNYFRSSIVDLCFLGRPWEDLGTHDQTSFGFMALSPKSLWEGPKEWELLPLLLQLASQFPQNIQRFHFTVVFQLPPYL